MYYRDSLMAENVVWLKRELYTQDRVVLWAANTHIAREDRQGERPEWMGEWLSSHYRETYCPIAFQKGGYMSQDVLDPAFGVRYPSRQVRFNAIILLNKLKKIGAEQWKTPCE